MIFNSVGDAMIDNVMKRVFLLYMISGLLFLFFPLKIETVNAHSGNVASALKDKKGNP